MLKSGMKAVEGISKAIKSKSGSDVFKAGMDTAKVVGKATKKKKQKTCKR